MNVVIFEPACRLLVHPTGTLRVPQEVLEQGDKDDPFPIVTAWARKLRLLNHGEQVRRMP